MRRQIFGLIYTHANRALLPVSQANCHHLIEAGYDARVLDLAQPEEFAALQAALATGNVTFCFGIQGVGSRLTTADGTNIWAKWRVPFIGVHYDSPCYNPFNHVNESLFVGNLYHYASFLAMKERYLASDQISLLAPWRFSTPLDVSPITFSERPIKLLYIKTGNGLDEEIAFFDNLPPAMRDMVRQQLAMAEADPNLSLGNMAEQVFAAAGLDWRVLQRQFWGLVQTMDVYLRRHRAIRFVNWLKHQPGAVIAGDGWDFIDKADATAHFLPSLDITETTRLYHQAQFICNTNPYGPDIVHERAVLGLTYGACVITDGNQWWDAHYGSVPALTLFRWDQALDPQLQPVINDTDAAKRAMTAPAASDRFFDRDAIRHLLVCAEEIRLRAGAEPTII